MENYKRELFKIKFILFYHKTKLVKKISAYIFKKKSPKITFFNPLSILNGENNENLSPFNTINL